MVIVYNRWGIVIAFTPLIFIGICAVYMPDGTEWMLLGLWGITMVLSDLIFRMVSEDGHWIHPRRGGHIYFIPVWIWGMGALAVYVKMALARGQWLPF